MPPVVVSCTHHSNNNAIYRCRPCDAVLCEECADVLAGGSARNAVQCKQCQALLEPLGAGAKRSAVSSAAAMGLHTPVWNRIPDIFGYVTEPSVLLGMLGLAIVVPGLQFLARWVPFFGILVGLFAIGIEAATFFRILETSAFGEKELDTPDLSSIVDVIAGPVLWYIACVLPVVASVFYIGWSALSALGSGVPPWQIFDGLGWPVFVFLFGVVMMPLFFAIAAIGRSVFAIYNPNHWIDSLKLMKWDYVFGAALFYVLLVFEFLLLLPLLGFFEVVVDIPIFTVVFVTFVTYMARAVRFRAIGVMCEPYMDRGHEAPREPSTEPEVPVARVVKRPREREDGPQASGAEARSPAIPAALGAAVMPVGEGGPRSQRATEAPNLSSRAPAVATGAASPTTAELRQALAAGDPAAVGACASPTFETLGRGQGASEELVNLYRTAVTAVPELELSDRALVAVLTAADKLGDAKLLVFATRKLLTAYPASAFLPRALWLTAAAQEQAGRSDLMEKSLRKLIEVAPLDPFADQARKKLETSWN